MRPPHERLSLWAGCLAAAVVLSGCKDRPAPPVDTPDPDPTPAPFVPPAPSSQPIASNRIDLPDLHHADPADMTAQARKIALAFDPNAVLVSITVREPATSGTVDVGGSAGVSYEFQWKYLNEAQGAVEGGLVVTARAGVFQLMEMKNAPLFLGPKTDHPDPGPDPRCNMRDAWKAAVAAGLPATMSASIKYAAQAPGRAGQPYVWTFRVAGHEDQHRDIDGATCAVRAAAAPPSAAVPPPPVPPPPPAPPPPPRPPVP